ncbi:MAG: hypothetical protein PWQ37_512 [Candidatus Petromonas sp.]|nr:hypothetical protein [Candidatus Petromonas sp.]
MESIGKRIRFARKKQNLTLTDINKLTGLSTGNLSELENDKFMPSANALIALKKILNVSIDWILTGEGPMKRDLLENNSIDKNKEDCEFVIKDRKCIAYSLSAEEQKLLEDYRKLDEEKRRDIQGFISVSLHKEDNNYICRNEKV